MIICVQQIGMIGLKKIICVVFTLTVCTAIIAQGKKSKVSMKDSLDGAFDLSNYIIDAHGFVPVPITITEPALGGFGGGIVPVFLKKKASLYRFGKRQTDCYPGCSRHYRSNYRLSEMGL